MTSRHTYVPDETIPAPAGDLGRSAAAPGPTQLMIGVYGNMRSGRSITLDFLAHVLRGVGVEVVSVDHGDHEMTVRLPPGAKHLFDGVRAVLPGGRQDERGLD